jgi:hypothetical protein
MARHDVKVDGTAYEFHDRRARAEIVVARRYLEHGFLDPAMRIFGRRAVLVSPDDWKSLVTQLLERGRVTDAVDVCQRGGIPLPTQELLTLGDRELRRKDVDAAVHYYALAGADAVRWSALVDVLIRLPGRELQATEITQRYLLAAEEPQLDEPRITAAA